MQHMQDTEAKAQTQLDEARKLLDSTLGPQVRGCAREGQGQSSKGHGQTAAALHAARHPQHRIALAQKSKYYNDLVNTATAYTVAIRQVGTLAACNPQRLYAPSHAATLLS